MGLIALNQMTYVRFLRPLTILNKSWFLSLNTLTSCLRYKKDLRQGCFRQWRMSFLFTALDFINKMRIWSFL